MTLALPRTLDKARAKEREQLARKAGCQYHTEIRDADWISFEGKVKTGKGFKPAVIWGEDGTGDTAWVGPIYEGRDDKTRRHALYHAEIAADTYRRYFLMNNGERYEIKRRQEQEAAQAEKRRKIDARKALTGDRVALYDALLWLARAVEEVRQYPANWDDCEAAVSHARTLLDKHHEAAKSIRSGEAL